MIKVILSVVEDLSQRTKVNLKLFFDFEYSYIRFSVVYDIFQNNIISLLNDFMLGLYKFNVFLKLNFLVFDSVVLYVFGF